jgi:hypothetical protein
MTRVSPIARTGKCIRHRAYVASANLHSLNDYLESDFIGFTFLRNRS